MAIGLDESGMDYNRDMAQDMAEEMRMVLRLHCVPGMDDRVRTSPSLRTTGA